MKKFSKVFLSLALVLILALPMLAGCANSTAYAKYVNYETKLETNGYYAIFQYEVKNDNDAKWAPAIDEYTFFFDGKNSNVSYGQKAEGIYYDEECTMNTGIDVGNQDFLVEPHTTQTFYLKVLIHENVFEFNKIQVVRDGHGTIQVINAK